MDERCESDRLVTAARGQEITLSASPSGCTVGPTCVLSGSAVLPPGEFLPVSIAGSRSRQLSTGVTIPDRSATIGQGGASRLAEVTQTGVPTATRSRSR